MGRGRIPMTLIENERIRKTSFEKRKNGLIKKVYEFSTLCDVDVCLIIYPPKFEGQEEFGEAETWPRDTREAKRIINKYYYNATSDKRVKVYDVKEYYTEKMKKVADEISKVVKETLKIKYPVWDESLKDLGEEESKMLVSMLDARRHECHQMIDDHMLKGRDGDDDDDINNINAAAVAVADHQKLISSDHPYLASNPNPNHNHQINISSSDQYSLPAFWAIHDENYSENPSCSSMLGLNGGVSTDWVNNYLQVGDTVGMSTLDEEAAGNNNHTTSLPNNYEYYDGNINTQIVQSSSYPPMVLETTDHLPSLPPLPLEYQYQYQYQTQTNQPPEAQAQPQPNGSYDANYNILQDNHDFINYYMHGRKE